MKTAVRRLVKLARHANPGTSDSDLARVLGVPKQKVCDWQRGRRKVPALALEKLCRLAGVQLDEVLLEIARETHRDRR